MNATKIILDPNGKNATAIKATRVAIEATRGVMLQSREDGGDVSALLNALDAMGESLRGMIDGDLIEVPLDVPGEEF